jgi:hypothetical protein
LTRSLHIRPMRSFTIPNCSLDLKRIIVRGLILLVCG